MKCGKKKLEIDAALLEKYVREGRNNEEIAEIFQCSQFVIASRVKEYGLLGIRKHGGKKKEKQEVKETAKRSEKKKSKGRNADRHLCRTCMYRAQSSAKYGCNYSGIVGKDTIG